MNVLIVEPDRGRCVALVAYLARQHGIRVIGAGGDLIAACRENQPPSPVDVLLIDIDQPGMSRVEQWAMIHLLLPEANVMALTKGHDARLLTAALGARVSALHPTDAKFPALLHALHSIHRGEADYDPDLLQRAKSLLVHLAQQNRSSLASAGHSPVFASANALDVRA